MEGRNSDSSDEDTFDVLISTAEPSATGEEGQLAATHDTASQGSSTPDASGRATSTPWA